MKVYLAGPMRGYKSFNFPAFTLAAKCLRDSGIDVLSPHEHDLEIGLDPDNEDLDAQGFSLEASMEWDLEAVLRSDAVVVLPGWERSTGVDIEIAIAQVTGRPVLEYPSLDPIKQEPVASNTRVFKTGAIRDTDVGKLDFEGALSPAVLCAFAAYMESHTHLPDGSTRTSDNWQKGFPESELMKSLLRHVFDIWMIHRGFDPVRPESYAGVDIHDAMGGAFFNLQALWLLYLNDEREAQ